MKSLFSSAKLMLGTFALVTILSCSPTVNYIGKTYSPSSNVDIYMDTNDIKRSYEVIGKVEGISAILGPSNDGDIQDKIVAEAKAKGADGIILYNMEKRIIGSSSTTDVQHRQWYNTQTYSNTSNITEDVLHADFIKYSN